MAQELHAARETVTRVELENRQYVADLQAFERQADTLTRELHRCVCILSLSLSHSAIPPCVCRSGGSAVCRL